MSKSDNVLIEVRPGRVRTALIENGRLAELIVEDESAPSLVGNIYLGRVEKVIDSLNAAFVDLGLERSGFLALAEVRLPGAQGNSKESISRHLCEGDKIVVQVQRDPFEDKGPKLTTRLALTARTVILTPGDPAIRISRRIDDKQPRDRLETLLGKNAGPEDGFIVRTAATGAPDEDIVADIDFLHKAFLGLEAGRDAGSPPALLWGVTDGVLRALRDLVPADAAKIVIDDTPAYLKARTYLEKQAPGLLERLICHNSSAPVFGDENLAEDLERALAVTVALPSGGSVIFSETPALVAIDINAAGTAKGGREQSSLKTNLEAAEEIARQVRLRNLSGLLVIDFVSMKNRDNGSKLLETLKRLVSGDPNQVFVGGFTRFGLVEMTRKRTRPSLATSLGRSCSTCGGAGAVLSPRSIAYEALDRLRVEVEAQPAQELELKTSNIVADALKGPLKEAVTALEKRLACKVSLSVDPVMEGEDFDIARGDT